MNTTANDTLTLKRRYWLVGLLALVGLYVVVMTLAGVVFFSNVGVLTAMAGRGISTIHWLDELKHLQVPVRL